ncbi:MAG: alkaline phosphatase family protein [Acidimicrobiales bacterium]|nr:alkaline phosphatase family protein [Acidimicrobiales bacterium]
MESDAVEHNGGSEPLALNRTLPTYDGHCVTAVAPALCAGVEADLVSDAVAAARTVVLLVVDGLGWHQLHRHRALAPALAAASAATPPITTVAPSTTATALTSLATGAAPGEHGLVGYRIATSLGLLNALRWRAGGRDARAELPPDELQPVEPFCGQPAAVVTRAEFRHSGFSGAHLRGGTFWGWHDLPGFVAAVRAAVDEGFRFVFAYYDTVDKIAHEFGLGERYHAALAETERLAVALRSDLPAAVPVIVTADHGVVEVLEPPVMVDPEVVALTDGWSGEARLLWLHACAGAESALASACERYAGIAEIAPVEQVLDEQWLGRHVTETARGRLGDVALVPRGLQAFTMPDEDQPHHALIGRHGGLTAEEMLVPFAQL